MINQPDLVFAVIAGTILFLLLTGFIIAFVLLYQKRKQLHTQEMITLKNTYDQELLRSQLEIQEATLLTISQEIHDNIGQVLSLAKLQLNTIATSITDANNDALNQTKELVGKAIADLRSLSKSLHPDRIKELGLEENIRQELEILKKTKLYTTHLKVNGSPYPLSSETQTILFRIVQECISNIIRHADASTVQVVVDYEALRFQLLITDNGKGFDVAAQKQNKMRGLGLRNMENRTTLLGAKYFINSNMGSGTTIQINLPAPTHPFTKA